MNATAFLAVLILVSSQALAADRNDASYDPLELPVAPETVEMRDFEVTDASRSRTIPLRLYALPSREKCPVILFSHGLGGSRENNPYLGRHWAARGFVVVFMQHAGSDEPVWKKAKPRERLAAMTKAANAENYLARALDGPAVLDQLEKWNAEDGHWLKGRLDLEKVGMSGHSFGALTTQALSGQSAPLIGAKYTDKRIDAALAMSPSPPPGLDPKAAFGRVTLPWMLMTGTKDNSPIGNATPESRRAVFPALPEGHKYELVLKDGEHMAFSERTLLGGKQRNPNHHRVILALSTAFWEAYLKADPAAAAWLDGDGPKGLLEAGDSWQRK